MTDLTMLSIKKGNCPSCNTKQPLDAMIKRVGKKDYECIDCKVIGENVINNEFIEYQNHLRTVEKVMNNKDVSKSKLTSLIKWCFG